MRPDTRRLWSALRRRSPTPCACCEQVRGHATGCALDPDAREDDSEHLQALADEEQERRDEARYHERGRR